jgi:hypothetical protein
MVLAELGAFWGAGKKVLMFMADPDLADSILPPQFKGTLRADTAARLIEAVKNATNEHEERDAQARQKTESIFFPTAGDYGGDREWAPLLDEKQKQFDVCGIAIGGWRQKKAFRSPVLAKAAGGCKVRFWSPSRSRRVQLPLTPGCFSRAWATT